MAQRRKQRSRWAKRTLFYILFPLIVWGVAFLVWFYWYDLQKLARKDYTDRPKTVRGNERESQEQPAKNGAQEKIQEEDRKKLEDIIKRRG